MDQPVSLMQPQSAVPATSTVVELRQYTMRPGGTDDLVALFDRHFVGGQEAAGIRVHGEFRRAARPDQFVWLRGWNGMDERERGLKAFYAGPMWKELRPAAVARMEDASNVLLLKPVDDKPFTLARRVTATLVATIYMLQAPVDEGFVRFFAERVKPMMEESGAAPMAELRTLYEKNTLPDRPVREGVHAFVWIAAFPGTEEYARHQERLRKSPRWPAVEKELAARLASPAEVLELNPTAGTMQRFAQAYDYSLGVTGTIRDFDFEEGSWSIWNRRLTQRGVGSTQWEFFPAHSKGKVLMGGVANVDEITFPTKGWGGVTFRHFDLEKKQWSIYWLNSRDGKIQGTPVVGGFSGNVGHFYGEDTDTDGRPVKVVYRWTKMGPDAARWEQAFSYDGGLTWETNWVNELTRETS